MRMTCRSPSAFFTSSNKTSSSSLAAEAPRAQRTADQDMPSPDSKPLQPFGPNFSTPYSDYSQTFNTGHAGFPFSWEKTSEEFIVVAGGKGSLVPDAVMLA